VSAAKTSVTASVEKIHIVSNRWRDQPELKAAQKRCSTVLQNSPAISAVAGAD